MQPSDHNITASPPGSAEAQPEGCEPEDFDHFTDLGLVRALHEYPGLERS